jgi:hypothetical protein
MRQKAKERYHQVPESIDHICPNRKRVPWQPGQELTPEITDLWEKTGYVTPGFRPCRQCKKIKPNNRLYFRMQRGKYKEDDGSRKLTTRCRSCINYNNRRDRALAAERRAQVPFEYRDPVQQIMDDPHMYDPLPPAEADIPY